MPQTVLAFLVVGLGGAVGAMSRFGLTLATLRYSGVWPIGTLASNILGCLVMGGLVELLSRVSWFAEGGVITDHNRLLFGVGFCGAFTTLSSFILEISTMMQRNETGLAFSYLALTLAGGYAAFAAGAVIVRSLQ